MDRFSIGEVRGALGPNASRSVFPVETVHCDVESLCCPDGNRISGVIKGGVDESLLIGPKAPEDVVLQRNIALVIDADAQPRPPVSPKTL